MHLNSLTSQSSSSFGVKTSTDISHQSSPNGSIAINSTKTFIEAETAKRNIETAKDNDSPQRTLKKEKQERRKSSSVNEAPNNEGEENVSGKHADVARVKSDDVMSSTASLKNSFNQSDISLKRQKLVRQKSFEIDSDETDVESIVENSRIEKVEKNSTTTSTKTKTKVENGTQTIEKSFPVKVSTKLEKVQSSSNKSSKSAKVHGTKKRPDLTIKIYDSSFDAGGAEADPVAEAFRSPSLHISGISINRSPPCVPILSANLSPKYQIHLPTGGGGHSTVLTVAPVNRNR